MENTKIKNIKTYMDDEDIQNFIIVNPIDFISEDQNKHILKVLKQGIKDENNPDKWMSWEESDRILAKEIFDEDI